MSTYLPENIRFLIRFGPAVLEPEQYRRQLRLELRRLIWFHTKQFPRPSRLDRDFIAVHRAEVDRILEEGGDDPEVRTAMRFVQALLVRGGRRHREAAVGIR
jgi:hypothetical protein